jgi:hypothetical protein
LGSSNMLIESEWRELCTAIDLHTSLAAERLPQALRPFVHHLANRFLDQRSPTCETELARRREQERIIGSIVTAICDLDDHPQSRQVAAELSEMELN